MKTNVQTKKSENPTTIKTHEGGIAKRINAEQQLRRSVMSCLLFERGFYENGVDIANRIFTLVPDVSPDIVANIAIEAREDMKLRHVPLLLCVALARNKSLKSETLARVIQRPDELSEFLSLYWAGKRTPIAASVKKGLASAFTKFSPYSLAKYDRKSVVKLRDVMFMVHPKPCNDEQARVWKKLVEGTLESPDTWEVELSGKHGVGKNESWTRLLREEKLGALALIRNLRNMIDAGVDPELIRASINSADVSKVLPFRFIAAARYAPAFEKELEAAMIRSIGSSKLDGDTIVLVDISGSMSCQLSSKSDMRAIDAACGVAMLVKEMNPDAVVYSFDNDVHLIGSSRTGFALRDAIVGSGGGGTYLGKAVSSMPKTHRLIVITDEQSADLVGQPKADVAYMINVASNKNGVGYKGKWNHIDGFSESVLKYIIAVES